MVCENSLALAPLKITPVTVNAIAPVLVTVIGIELLVLPTICEAKLTDAGEKFAPAAGTVVLSKTKTLFPPLQHQVLLAIVVHIGGGEKTFQEP